MDNKQQEAKDELINKGAAYDELTRMKGWEYTKEYTRQKLAAFTNRALLGPGFASMEEYREARGEVNGLRNYIADIEHAMKIFHEERTKTTKTE